MSDPSPRPLRFDDRWLWGLLILAFCILVQVQCIHSQKRPLKLSGERFVGALREACESASTGMTPAMLFSHFPRATYNPRCLSATQDCGEFEATDGTMRHFPCPRGDCAMYWQEGPQTCRVDLSDDRHMALGAGVVTGGKSPL